MSENKKYVKKIWTDHPVYVVKPLDFQGQRGIYTLDAISDIRVKFKKVLSYSRQDDIFT